MRKEKKFIFAGFISTFFVMFLVFTPHGLEAKTDEENVVTRLEAIKKFEEVLSTIEYKYVDDVDFEDVINKAIDGLLKNLDAHSSFMSADEFDDFQEKMSGEFGGLGIVVGLRDGALTVISPIDDTPASEVGIEAQDIILRIDEKSTIDMGLSEAVSLMRGEPGTEVTLTVVREGEKKPLTFPITRDVINVKSVESKIIEGDHLYIRVKSFDNNVVEGVKKALKEHEANGIILDLRNNPGGDLYQAIGLTDLFVDEGVIVSQKGKIDSENTVYDAKSRGSDTQTPMVVLVNGGSASASEIVSGALQDHKRAVIVGKNTFGKGSVQQILQVGKGNEAIRLTVAKYYLPSGRTIQAVGIDPDIVVDAGKIEKSDESAFSIREKDLKLHLKQELEETAKKSAKEKSDTSDAIISNDDLYEDAQLKTAVDILKSLIIVQGRK